MTLCPRAHLLLVGALLAASAGAQTVVVPPRFTAAEADSYTGFPFGRSTPVRVQHYCAATYFTGRVSVTRVAFRADGGKALAAKSVDLEMWLTTGPADVDGLSASFPANRGSDWTGCFTRKTVQLPAVVAAPGPRPFDVAFDLDRAFPYDPARGGLVVEMLVYGQPPGSYDLDLGTGCTSVHADFGGPACKGSNGKAPVADCPTTALLWGGAFVMRARDAAPHAPVGLLLGTRESGLWLGLALPFPLDSVGAPGCSLNADIALVLGAAADAAGEVRQPGQLPRDARLLGFWLRFQALVLDRTANPAGFVLSNGSKTEVCGPDLVARVVATSAVAVTGQLEIGLSPVTSFAVQ